MEMTQAQNEELVVINNALSEFNTQLESPLSIVVSKDLKALIEQKNLLLSVFVKLKPIFETFGGNAAGGELDPMAIIQMMPAIKSLQADEQLKKDLENVIALIA